MEIIGERLRGLRESVRLSQAKLAKEFDVSQSALARYEIDDSTPSPEVFLKYADYFDVSVAARARWQTARVPCQI